MRRTVVHPQVLLPVPVELLLPLPAEEAHELVAALEVLHAEADLGVCGGGVCGVYGGRRVSGAGSQ